tara:strand:- start:290 stop:463 length:174 start_codon:yes stop_codon:yes gene_type:complete
MNEPIKNTLDVSAATTGAIVWLEWIHPLAGIFTIVWLSISIYQSPTVQKLFKRKKNG